jgi:hypothetical protein
MGGDGKERLAEERIIYDRRVGRGERTSNLKHDRTSRKYRAGVGGEFYNARRRMIVS